MADKYDDEAKTLLDDFDDWIDISPAERAATAALIRRLCDEARTDEREKAIAACAKLDAERRRVEDAGLAADLTRYTPDQCIRAIRAIDTQKVGAESGCVWRNHRHTDSAVDTAVLRPLYEPMTVVDTAWVEGEPELLMSDDEWWTFNELYSAGWAPDTIRDVDAAATEAATSELFYIENTDHSFDFKLWWGPKSSGYTVILEDAGLYTETHARSQERSRSSDIARRKSDVDAAAAGRVVGRRTPLKGTIE